MKYVISMTLRLNGSATENEAAVRRTMDLYSKWTPPESATIHQFVGRLDGGGNFAVIETDNPADIAATTSKFAPFAEYQVYPVLDVNEAVQAVQEGVEFRKSVS